MADNNKIFISMLGNFEISTQNYTITESSNRSKKMWNLLGYIIAYRHRYISQTEYIDLLWPNGSSSNPVNALKTLLYRLRSLLEPIATHNEQFILSTQGSYHWNTSLNHTVDAELFEALCNKASNPQQATQERIALFKEALALYKGDFLSKHANELWVIPIATHYHSLYLDTVKDFLILLEKEKLFDHMEYYCTKALQIDQFNESLHCFLVRAFLNQGNSIAALNHYEKSTEILYQNLGVRPSKELRSLYLEIMRTQKTLETDLEVIQNDLKEADFKTGPFLCEYCIFQETYRLIARQAARDGLSVYICLITLSDVKGTIPSLTKLDYTMKRLLDSISLCLRRGDVVAKYSGAQYVILLPSITYEDGRLVMERIFKKYYENNVKSIFHLKYKLRQIDISSEI